MRQLSFNHRWRAAISGVIITVVPIIGLTLFVYMQVAQYIKNCIVTEDQQSALVVSGHLRDALDNEIRLGNLLVSRKVLKDAVKGADRKEITRHLRDFIDNSVTVERTYITDPMGVMLADYPANPSLFNADLSQRPWYNSFFRERRRGVSDFYLRTVKPQRYLFAVVLPIRADDNSIIGILVSQPKENYVKNAMSHIPDLQHQTVYVVDKKGNLIYHSKYTVDKVMDFSGFPAVQKIRLGQSGVETFSDKDGRRMLTAYHPVEGYGWGIVVERPEREVFAPLRKITFGLFAFASAMFLTGAYFACKRAHLIHSLQKFSEELETRVAARTSELKLEIDERKNAERRLREEKLFSENIINGSPAVICEIAPDGTTTFINPPGEAITGYTSSELKGKNWWKVFYPGDEYRQVEQLFLDFKKDNQVRDYEMTLTTRDGHKRSISWNSLNRYNEEGNIIRIVGLGHDITERKKAVKEMEKVNRALWMLSKCNEAAVHAADTASFQEEICRIIVEDGKYLMAWIGYLQPDKEKPVLPVACAGHVDGHPANINLKSMNNEWGRGTTGTAIRTGEVCVQTGMSNDLRHIPGAEETAGRGPYAIGLPLIGEGQCFGALTIYAPESDIFLEIEKKLLKELADDIAFGITALRMRAANRLANKQLKKSHEQLRDLADHLQSVREEERTIIARNIHDELGQALTAMKLDLSWVRDNYGDHNQLFGKIEDILRTLNGTILSVKRICTELRPWLLDDFGLIAAMEWLANEFQERTGIECTVIEEPWDIDMDKDRSIVLYRIFQEALTNVLKHAKATKVTARLLQDDRHVILEIRDNGKGITGEQLSKPKSFGLVGMRERAYPWGGEVEISGTEGAGTTVKVIMPLFPQKHRLIKS